MDDSEDTEFNPLDFPPEEFHVEFVKLLTGEADMQVTLSGDALEFLEASAHQHGMTLDEYFEKILKPRMLTANDA